MFSLFKENKILSDEDIYFQIETYKWLLSELGKDYFLEKTELILPTDDFFPILVNESEDFPEQIFSFVKKHAGMEEWDFELREQNSEPDDCVSPGILISNSPRYPLGDIYEDNHKTIISYAPSLLHSPMKLIAILSHQLACCLSSTINSYPPGGEENWEFAIDMIDVFIGFGVFSLNSAFTFSQDSDIESIGWQSQCIGYLSEIEFAYSLCIFLRLKRIPEKNVYPYLKPHLQKKLKKCLASFDQIELEGGKAVDVILT